MQTLREFKEKENEDYQESLNDEKLQNDLREWRDLKNTPEETNRREFEEIKKIVLYFRDWYMFCLDWYELGKKETKRQRKSVNYHNELLQLDYSLANLQTLREFKENYNENYQESLNDEELQNDLREWRRTKRR
ncbi:hypothetical protein FE342_04600 [Helicobacter pylori]|nr:hypothetical protein FE342_04600 [Helicobacter pylori]